MGCLATRNWCASASSRIHCVHHCPAGVPCTHLVHLVTCVAVLLTKLWTDGTFTLHGHTSSNAQWLSCESCAASFAHIVLSLEEPGGWEWRCSTTANRPELPGITSNQTLVNKGESNAPTTADATQTEGHQAPVEGHRAPVEGWWWWWWWWVCRTCTCTGMCWSMARAHPPHCGPPRCPGGGGGENAQTPVVFDDQAVEGGHR